MRLLLVTQTLDADHPALAQTLDVVGELAMRADELVVLCATVGRHEQLPTNVRVRTFGARTRLGRGASFVRALVTELRDPPAALLAHMVPLFLVLAAPLARARGLRLLLWYTHWHAGHTLRLAERLAHVVLSVDASSFPLATRKVRGIGHAIDVEAFSPAAEAPAGPPRFLALGRTARWKGYDTLLDGFEQALAAGLEATLEVRGPSLTDDERAHREELAQRIEASDLLRAKVRLLEPLPRARLPELLRHATALVSATQPDGSETLDKVVYEAAACAVPVLASNSALATFLDGVPLELRFPRRDPAALAERLLALAAAPPQLRREAGLELRRRVVAAHSVGSWAAAVVAAAQE